ncbi:biopolymer transporter ExbD [Cognatiyoonia sp. IB215446]|uniref:biopolymer transporter ExbD n=1 Tax=Cognatiyoonia sp. IB215446 TaxID=3097355 RepID=UPI002A181FAF|nr:biopolymer transporter ExbD [Cognatiyoonia sp. IB215446]MDX8350712.1 biopolymer transporter ExbD [Cognatiyoonia sp. IB215446]
MLKAKRQKRAISMTPLVDVIFLLLLFFMLTSTFSKFAEVELSAAAAGGTSPGTPPIFLQLYPDRLTVNGQTQPLDGLVLEPQAGQTLLVALQTDVTAQRLTDLLVALRAFPNLDIAVLGSS